MTLRETPKLVFICGTPRSGGAVTHASFESHPDILVWPYEFFYFMFFRSVSKGAPKASIRKLNAALEKEFGKELQKRLDKSSLASDEPLDLENLRAGPFSYPEFKAALHALEEREVDSHEYLFLLFDCLKRSNAAYREAPVKYFLVLSTARGVDWADAELLAGAWFLFSSREMESSYTSLRDKYFRTKGIHLCRFFSIFSKRSALYWMETFRRLSRYIEPVVGGRNFVNVPLKRLQSEPDAMRAEICKVLAIEATPGVFELTLFGEPYYGSANQEDLNNGRIARAPSATRIEMCSFARRVFAALGLFDFDTDHPRKRVPFAPWAALSLAFRSAFGEFEAEDVWSDPNASPLKVLAGRVWIFLNLCAIYAILKSERLTWHVVRSSRSCSATNRFPAALKWAP
jgi:hypothetical protein